MSLPAPRMMAGVRQKEDDAGLSVHRLVVACAYMRHWVFRAEPSHPKNIALGANKHKLSHVGGWCCGRHRDICSAYRHSIRVSAISHPFPIASPAAGWGAV